MIILVYVDDCILISKEDLVIQNFIRSLKAGTEDFVFTEEGTMNSYLGVDISSFPDKKGFTLSQPFSLDRVIQALNFDTKTSKSATLMLILLVDGKMAITTVRNQYSHEHILL